MNNRRNSSAKALVDRRQFLKTAGAAYGGIAMSPGRDTSEAASPAPESGSAEAIYLTDLERCQPQSALARKPMRNRWRLLDCETDHSRGVMLVVGQKEVEPDMAKDLGIGGRAAADPTPKGAVSGKEVGFEAVGGEHALHPRR